MHQSTVNSNTPVISDLIAETLPTAKRAENETGLDTVFLMPRNDDHDIMPLFERLRDEGFTCSFAQDSEVFFTNSDKTSAVHVSPAGESATEWTICVQEDG